MGEISLPNFQTYYIARVMKALWNWGKKDKKINEIQSTQKETQANAPN